MRIRTSDLTDKALSWAVAKAQNELIEKVQYTDHDANAGLTKQWHDTWMIGDVRALGIRPDLSNKEMIDVLDEIFTNLDARQGVNDEVIEKVANEMFPFLFLNATARWQGKHDHDEPCIIPVIIDMNDGEIYFNGKDDEELTKQNAKDMSIFFEKYDENGGVSLIAISSATFEHLYKNDDQALAIMTRLRTELGEEGIAAIRADMNSELNISSEPSI